MRRATIFPAVQIFLDKYLSTVFSVGETASVA